LKRLEDVGRRVGIYMGMFLWGGEYGGLLKGPVL